MTQPNFANRSLYHVDNLAVLHGMNSETVDLIATDPPFNKGRDFHATPDSLAKGASFQDRWSWERDVHDEWSQQLEDRWPKVWHVVQGSRESYGDDMGAFLCFMAVRLLEMRRVLKETGSLYLHCDPTASHYLKMLLDSIFGKKNFRNEIVWKRTNPKGNAKRYASITDTILFYTKGKEYTWNPYRTPLSGETIRKWYVNDDNDGRGPYNRLVLTAPGSPDPEFATWRGVRLEKRRWNAPATGVVAYVIERDFIPGYKSLGSVLERLEALDRAGLIHWPKNTKSRPSLKQYTSMSVGAAPVSLFDDLPMMRDLPKERTEYPTQKPLALYERIIRASSNEGDIVLDPFCGCATTCVAAEKLGRQWVGIDIWDNAHDMVVDRLKREGFLEGPDGARPDLLLAEGRITYSNGPPVRTDDGQEAAPYMSTVERRLEVSDGFKSNAERLEYLADKYGLMCQGCGLELPHRRHFELDHVHPKSSGGSNSIDNRMLLCGACNRVKSNRLTLPGLRAENRKNGYMVRKLPKNGLVMLPRR